ncbi:MAG: TonB domain/peptidase domain protein [Planctomycetaceae bacterium]|nr:TonB domain/peptidase domain protein [Planctomycetaceae bacterium]
MNSLVERLGWVLVHSVWQFAIVALLVGLVIRTLRRRSAAIRYCLLVAAMALSVVAPGLTWVLQPDDRSKSSVNRLDQPVIEPQSKVEVVSDSVATLQPHDPDLSEVSTESGIDAANLRNLPSDNSRYLGHPPDEDQTIAPPISPRELSWTERVQSDLRPWLAWIVASWSLGVVIGSLRPLLGWYTLGRLRRTGISPVSDEILTAMRRISDRLGLRRTVRVFYSTLARVPVVVGYLRPVVLIPVSLMTRIPSTQLEAILAHELAHVRRHDFIVNLLQTLIETLFFYHPAIWWISHQIRVEREHCCDDLVVGLLGNRVEYGRALLAVEELRGRSTLLAPGATDGSLLSRIRRIVLGATSEPYRPTWWGSSLIVLLFVAVSFTATVLLPTDSLASAKPYLVTLPDGSNVELLGITSDGTDPAQWWLPNGTARKDDPLPGQKITSNPDWNEGRRRFAVRTTGAKLVHWVLPGDGMEQSAATVGQGPDWLREECIRTNGIASLEPTTIYCGLGETDFGPWATVDRKGDLLPLPAIGSDLRPYYAAVKPLRIDATNGQTQLILQLYRDGQLRFIAGEEWVVVTKGGVRRFKVGSSDSPGSLQVSFDLKSEDVDHFEFRFKSFRYWVKYENVSLRRDQKTEVKVTTEQPSSMKPAASSVDQKPSIKLDADAKETLLIQLAAIGDRFFVSMVRRDFEFLELEQLEVMRDELQDELASYVVCPVENKWHQQVLQAVETYCTDVNHRRFAFPKSFMTDFAILKHHLRTALDRDELTADEIARRESQRQWFRDHARTLPDPSGGRIATWSTRTGEKWETTTLEFKLKELEDVMTDPLNPYFAWPVTDEEFRGVQEAARGQKWLVRKSDLNGIAGIAFDPMSDLQFMRVKKRWPIKHPAAVTDGFAKNLWMWDAKHAERQVSSLTRKLSDNSVNDKDTDRPENEIPLKLKPLPEAGLNVPVDLAGDPLLPGMLQRFGTTRYKTMGWQRSLAFSGDDEWVWCKTSRNVAAMHRKTGRVVNCDWTRLGAGNVESMAISPDGKLLAIAITELPRNPKSNGFRVLILDSQTGLERRVIRWTDEYSPVTCLSFGDGGRKLLTGTSLGDVRLWDLATGQQLNRQSFDEAGLSAAAIAPESGNVVLTGLNNSFLWRPGALVPRVLNPKLTNQVTATFSPDGKWFATGGFIEPDGTRLWNANTGEMIARLQADFNVGNPDGGMAFSPDGKILAIPVYTSNRVELWDVEKRTRTSALATRAPRSVAYSHNGKWLAVTGTVARVSLFNMATLRETNTVEGHNDPVHGLRFAGNQLLVSAAHDDAICVWDVNTGRPTTRIIHDHHTMGGGFAVSPDGQTIVSNAYEKRQNNFEDKLYVWNRETGKKLLTLKGHGAVSGTRAVGFVPNGSRFASWGDDQILRWWSSKTEGLKSNLISERAIKCPDNLPPNDPRGAVIINMRALFAPDASALFVFVNNVLHEFDTSTGEPRRSVPARGDSQIALSADGRWLATTEHLKFFDPQSPRVILRDRATLEIVRTWQVVDPLGPRARAKPADAPMNEQVAPPEPSLFSFGAMEFSPDSKQLAWSRYGTRNAIDVADVESGTMTSLIPLPSACRSLTFSPDGTRLATGHDDTTVSLWQLHQFREVPKRIDAKAALDETKPADHPPVAELLTAMIRQPSLMLLKQLLATTPVPQPEPVELVNAVRNQDVKQGIHVKVVTSGTDQFALVAARVKRVIGDAGGVIENEPAQMPECVFVFDRQGQFIASIGGEISQTREGSEDDVDIINLGPKEDWFVRVMRFEEYRPFSFQSDYYRIANPVVKSLRYSHYPNSNPWSHGPETIPRFGSLYFQSQSQSDRNKLAGETIGATPDGVAVNSIIFWDADRNRFVGPAAQRVKQEALYQVDTQWSREFEALAPKSDQLVVSGGAREYDNWHIWHGIVPNGFVAILTLTLPQATGQPVVIEKQLAAGPQLLQLRVASTASGTATDLELLIGPEKSTYVLPLPLGERPAIHPPIVQTVNSGQSVRLLNRPLKSSPDTLTFELKPQSKNSNQPVAAADTEKLRQEEEIAARKVLRETYHVMIPMSPKEDPPQELVLFNLPAEAWEHVGHLTGIPRIHVSAGDLRGEPMRQIARISGLKWLRIVNAKCLPTDLESLSGHPTLEHLNAMLTIFEEIALESDHARLVSQFTDDERTWIEVEHARLLERYPGSSRRHLLEAAVATDRALASLSRLTKLSSLELINTACSRRGLATLQKLPVLKELNIPLVYAPWTAEPALANFPQLRRFGTIADMPQLITDMTAAAKLEALEIRGASDKTVALLTKNTDFKELNLWVHTLSDAGLLKLAELPHLAQINLGQSQGTLTKAGVAKFRSLKPDCVVHLDKNLVDAAVQADAAPVPPAAEVSKVGTFKGRFVYDGAPPERKDLCPQYANIDLKKPIAEDSQGRFSGVEMIYREFLRNGIRPDTKDASLLVAEDRGIANVIIWATSKNIPWTPPKDIGQHPVTIQVKNGNFTPRVAILTVGQTLLLGNEDPVPFNCHVYPVRNPDSNVLLKPGSSKNPVRVSFNIAESVPTMYRGDQSAWAKGFLFIPGNSFAAVTQADGTFTIPNIPPGQWEFRAWQERCGFVRNWPKGQFTQVIKTGNNDIGTIKLKPEFFDTNDSTANRVSRSTVTPEDVLSRKVSLQAAALPLKTAIQRLAQAANVKLQLNADDLLQVGVDVERPVTVTVRDSQLVDALQDVIRWNKHPGAMWKVRGGILVITTLQAEQEAVKKYLPAWLLPLYNNGLLADLDDEHHLISITAGAAATDQLLGQLKKLPKLTELDFHPTQPVTAEGIFQLAKLSSLQKLSLSGLNQHGKGLGDVALQGVSGLKSLRELSLGECGITDTGVKWLETLPQLTHLTISGEGRLTDAALGSIGKLKQLKQLSLSSYVATKELGWMRFSGEGIRQLSGLRGLEELHLVGQSVPADALDFPQLKSLSLGSAEIDDACAERIAKFKNLESLNLVYTNISDAGLKAIATLPELKRLTLDSRTITDAGIAHLKQLPQLESITLRVSNLTDESLKHLAGIPSLRRIDLYGSDEPGSGRGKCFSIPGVQQLKSLSNLRTLWLNNFESGGGWGGLKELTQLRELSLMMTDIGDAELEVLEEALPNTTIHNATGGGKVVRIPATKD